MPWWVSATAPLVIRLPKGIALLVVAGLILLLIAAYGIGYTQGKSAGAVGQPDGDRQIENLNMFSRGVPSPLVPDQSGDGRPDQIDQQRAQDTAEAMLAGRLTSHGRSDPRKVGLNYMRLALYPDDEALRLAKFLAEHGVETVFDKVDNGRFVVTAVNQGFVGGDGGNLSSEDRNAYESQLRSLGRAWKRHNNNRGDDLHTMLFVKHKGPASPTE